MDPLTIALISAFSAAASALLGGVADAAGGDAWAAAKTRLASWTRLSSRKQHDAFAAAVATAVARLRREWPEPSQVEQALAVLVNHGPEATAFVRAAVEQLLLSADPDQEQLLDLYRRQYRFVMALRGEALPDWSLVEPVLTAFLCEALPAALRDQRTIRPLLLEQAQLHALDQARATNAAVLEQTAVLERMALLLADIHTQPRIQATLPALGTTSSNAPVNILLRDYATLPPTTLADLKMIFGRYCDYVRGEYELLDFRGILQVQNALKLRLEAIYVSLHAAAPQRTLVPDHARSATEQRALERTLPVDGRVSVHQLIRAVPRLVILGDPGSGKSTLVKYVMLSLLQNQGRERLGLSSAWLPILFPVAGFAETLQRRPNLAPLDYLHDFYNRQSHPEFYQLFVRALLSGRALLLFDGLDEVRDSAERLEIVRCLESFVRAWDLPGNRFLATSRIAGYRDAPLNAGLFEQIAILAFDEADIRQFVHKWSAAYELAGRDDRMSQAELERRATEHERDLASAIFANPQATELAANPLLLTMLALIRHQGVTLPNRRVELYQLCIKTLAETWNRARSLSGRPIDAYLKRNQQRLDEGFVVNLLGPTALWVHEEKPGGLVEQAELERRLARTFRESYNVPKGEAADLARDFLQLVEQQTGLLQARGKNLYGFLHLTLEEYLAARALLDQREETPGLLQDYALTAGWREVVRLCVASLQGQRGTQRALEELLATPTTAETYGIPAIRAGECLLDIGPSGTTPQANSKVLQALLDAIADLSVPIATRVEAGHTLGRLGDPRLLDAQRGEAAGLGDYTGVESYWCAIEHGPFWFGDDQVDRPEIGGRRDKDSPPQPPRFDPARLKRVELPHPFKIARYPVTNAEFARFLAANGPDGYDPTKPWWTEQGRTFLAPGGHRHDDQEEFVRQPRLWGDTRFNAPSQPVVCVSWYEAAAYCRWLSAEGYQRGWLPADQIIRLPTSLEWERAARHTDTRPFPWGEVIPTAEHANFADAGVGAPAPVGCFRASRAMCGADDLIGNVLEWLATPYDAGANPQPQKDFTPNSGVALSYTYYGDDLAQMCCGTRGWYYSGSGYFNCGFRVVLSRALTE
jgi:formylglycine-generating enzyme required for sulfatase activity